MKISLGRHVFGLAAIGYGIVTLQWHQVDSLGDITHPAYTVYVFGIVEIICGFALQLKRTVMFGALLLMTIFLIFSIYCILQIIKAPLSFASYGNFFEKFSILTGSIFVAASSAPGYPEKKTKLVGIIYICYGICVLSYALYQLFYLTYTANLVPKWILPGQMFWTVTTTIAFALAAIAIITGRLSLLASRLLTLMLIIFGILIWVPACIADPHNMSNWSENVENLAMAASAWIVTDYLYQTKIAGT